VHLPIHYLLRRCLAALLIAACALPVGAEIVRTPHVTAELVAEKTSVRPGADIRIGLKLQHIPHWHTYWRNPGDSGLPTTLEWTLPAGSRVGAIEWPAPQRLPLGPLVNYGYEGELLLPMVFTAPADARPGETLELAARATWLVCKDVCIPETGLLSLKLPVVAAGTAAMATSEAPLFERATSDLAAPLAGWTARVQHAGRDLLLALDRDVPNADAATPAIEVFPHVEQLLEPAVHEVYRTASGYAVKLRLLDDAAVPASLDAIAVAPSPRAWGGSARSVAFDAALSPVVALAMPEGAKLLSGSAMATAAADESASSGAQPAVMASGSTIGLWSALGLALVGGLILNLMPCVFPVLSIKLLGLAQSSSDRRVLRAHAWAYGAGVVMSFLALAGALLALRALGSAIGWGFQLQEPAVVFVLALLFFAIGLNLMGSFEFASLMPQRLAGWRAERPSVDAFACGVLAVVAASPCTAPFMGAALGFAATQPAAVALSVFAALGLGMALPYMALVLMPGWRARLPRPGPWMLRLKQALAFPMFATVVWLLWVLGQQSGIDGVGKALLALLGFAFLLWLLGLPWLRGATVRGVAVLALGGLLAWSWPVLLPVASAQAVAAATAEADTTWQPYDEVAIEQRVAAGQPVFVDFTAAWCVSCQVNKRLVLHRPETQRAFADAGVALMRADWTYRDPVITKALERLGRNGVPVYVLIRPGREPLLLPEILTARLVRDALATL